MASAIDERRKTLPDRMLALELSGSGLEALRVVERELPRPGPAQVLCRVDAASVCSSDGKLVRLGSRHRNLHGWNPSRKPLIPGHEGSLTVVEAGTRLESQFRPGQRLVLAPNLPGPPRFDREAYGSRPESIDRITVGFTLPGLLAQYVLLREDVLEARGHLLPVSGPPSLLPHYAASLAEPLSTVVAAHAHMVHVLPSPVDGERVYRPGVLPGGLTVVIGAGPMGMLHAAYALLRRPRQILVSDPLAPRRQAVLRLREQAEREFSTLEAVEPGELRTEVLRRSEGRGADDIIVAAGAPGVEEEAVALAGPGACVSFFASHPPGEDLARLPAGAIHYRSISVSGTSGGDPLDLRRAIELQEHGAVDLRHLVAAVGGLAAAPAAVEGLLEGRFDGKVVIYPHAAAPELVHVTTWGPEAEASFLNETP